MRHKAVVVRTQMEYLGHMDTEYDIRKAGAIIISDHKVLEVRSVGKDIFVVPGGKLEPGETPTKALIRELHEELSLNLLPTDIKPFGTYYAIAAGSKGTKLRMDTFIVDVDPEEIELDNEIEELVWIDSHTVTDYKLGSIFEHDIFPELLRRGLVE